MTTDSTPGTRAMVMDAFAEHPFATRDHAGSAFPTDALRRIEEILPAAIESSIETGCGKSTILFSNIASRHKTFTLDDQSSADSSVKFFRECSLTRNERIEVIFGPTQETLPRYSFQEQFDAVLIDGPHGYPFPELEYHILYPHIKKGGYLILDDVAIPTVGRLADFIAEDDMFELVEVVGYNTAVFRRTAAPTFDPHGDGWWQQKYNRRRVSPKREIFLDDGPVAHAITSQRLDHRLWGTAGDPVLKSWMKSLLLKTKRFFSI